MDDPDVDDVSDATTVCLPGTQTNDLIERQEPEKEEAEEDESVEESCALDAGEHGDSDGAEVEHVDDEVATLRAKVHAKSKAKVKGKAKGKPKCVVKSKAKGKAKGKRQRFIK